MKLAVSCNLVNIQDAAAAIEAMEEAVAMVSAMLLGVELASMDVSSVLMLCLSVLL